MGGTEQVYLIETFTNCRLSEWDGIFTAGGSPVVTQKFLFPFQKMTITVPPTAPASAPKTAPPLIQRRPLPIKPMGTVALLVHSAQITAFQSALTGHKSLKPVMIDFLDGSTKLFTLKLNETDITADSQNVSGGQATENVTFAASHTGEIFTYDAANAQAAF